jgi:hypothetical protein
MISLKAGASLHIPFHADSTPAEVMKADMNAWILGTHVRLISEMRHTMLPFHRVIGLTTIHPAAIHADAHAPHL